MQLRIDPPRRDQVKIAALAFAAVLVALVMLKPLLRVGGLALGAALICFVITPLERLYERRLPRPLSALLCLLTVALIAAGFVWLLLPAMLRALIELSGTLPRSIATLADWFALVRERIEARIPGVALPELDLVGMQGAIAGAISGALSMASGLAEAIGQISMMVVLAYFLLCEREKLMLRLELLLPRTFRPTAVRMAAEAGRELRLYLRGQLLIAAAVALLSTAALMLVGVRGALALGPIVGLFNMIPYFGPYIGGLPAVLIALGDGWQRACLAVLALAIVQQLDGSWISPRIMSSLTGFSPALVLVGIYAGACVAGIAGMLFALPVMMTTRTLFRVFVQKCENI